MIFCEITSLSKKTNAVGTGINLLFFKLNFEKHYERKTERKLPKNMI